MCKDINQDGTQLFWKLKALGESIHIKEQNNQYEVKIILHACVCSELFFKVHTIMCVNYTVIQVILRLVHSLFGKNLFLSKQALGDLVWHADQNGQRPAPG